MRLPTHIAALSSKSLSWIVPASYLILLLLLLPSTIYSQRSNPPQNQVMSCPSSLFNAHHRFPSPQRKVQDFPGYIRPYVILPLATISDFIFYYFSPPSGPPTLASMLSLEHAQVLSCLRLLPRIFFPSYCHGSFLPYFSLHSKATFRVKDFPDNI